MDLEEIRLVTEFASLAPSVHNTQPWRFVMDGHTLQVRADTSRGLPYLDPKALQAEPGVTIGVPSVHPGLRKTQY